MRKLTLLLALSVLWLCSDAQIGGGARVGYSKYLGGTGINTIGLGAYGNYAIDDQKGVRVGFQYGLPVISDDTYTAHALDNFTEPQSIQVDGKSTLNTMNLYLDGKKYFGNADFDEGGFYVIVGAGLTMASEQTEYEEYAGPYSVTGFADEGEKEKFTQVMLRGFAGYEISLSAMKVFVEGGFSIPAAESNSRTGSTATLPGFLELAAGVRF
jgi:hypothetical protein